MPRKSDAETIRSFLDELWKQAQGMLGKGKARAAQSLQTAQYKLDLYLLSGKRENLQQRLGELFYRSTKRRKPSLKKQQKLLTLVAEIKELDAHEKSLRKSLRRSEAEATVKPRRRGRPRKNKTVVKSRAARAPRANRARITEKPA